jgi:hypothetical protein
MINRNPWFGLVIILIAALGLAACGQEPTYEKIEPAELVDQGDGRNLVILTEKAAERLDIQTETVREESIHLTRTYGGQVSKSSGDSAAMVMVSLTEEEKGMVDTNFPALIIPLEDDDEEDSDEEESGFSAEFDELPDFMTSMAKPGFISAQNHFISYEFPWLSTISKMIWLS